MAQEVSMMDTKVNGLHGELEGKLSSLQSILEKQTKHYERKHKELHEKSKKTMESTLNDLCIRVDKLIKVHHKQQSNEKHGDAFFYQKPLENIFKEEECFTATLTDYTRKQFFGGISDLAGGNDDSKYEMIDTGKPDSFLIKGEDGGVKEQEREELKRLQSSYLRSKLSCINADVSCVKYKKAVEVAERQLKMLKSLNNFDVTNKQLAGKIESLYNEINVCQSKLKHLYASGLSPILENLQQLNSAKVIQGDYNLKLLRQDYFFSKQNEVIKHLLVQFSRNYLLTMVYEVEYKMHTNSHHLLSTLQSLFTGEIPNIEGRTSLLKHLISEVNPEKQVIGTNDVHMNLVYEAVMGSKADNPELYRSYNNLNAAVTQCSQSYKINKGVLESTETEKKESMSHIETILNDAEQIIKSSKEKSNEELSLLVSNLEDNLSMAEVQINEVIKDIMEKKNLLSVDRSEEMKRTIFADFLNNPVRLKRNLDDLISRVNSLTVSS